MIYQLLANDINEINMLQDTFPKNSLLSFTHELNKNNKISFSAVLIDINDNNNFTISTNLLITTPVLSTLKVNVSSDINKEIIDNSYLVQN